MNGSRLISSQKRPLQEFLSILLIIFLLTQACNLSIPGGTPPTPSGVPPTATAAPSPTAMPNLPPMLIDTDPPPHSSLAVKNPVTFYFNQPIDKPSAEAALTPPKGITGRVEWVDAATMRFVPSDNYPTGGEVKFALKSQVKAVNGKSLPEDMSITFRAPEKFSVAERLPAPGAKGVDAAASIVVSFNQPVIALDAEGSQNLPQAFTLSPSIKGRGEWLNTSTYVFYGDPGLPGGQTISVQINSDLTSNQGVALTAEQAKAFSWSFSTALPQLLGIETNREQEKTILLDQKFTLSFNQAMNPESVEKALVFSNEKGIALPGNFTWSENNTKLVFQPKELLERGKAYQLTLNASAQSAGGSAIGQKQGFTYQTVGKFSVVGTTPAVTSPLKLVSGWSSFTVNFASPLAKQDVKKLVVIEPSPSSIFVDGREGASGLTVGGYFTPQAKYVLKISSGLKDLYGQPLEKPVEISFQIGAEAPSISIPSQGASGSTVFVSSSETALPVRLTNVRQLNLETAGLTVDDFIRLSERPDQLRTYQPPSKTAWNQTIETKADQNELIAAKLTANGAALPSGLYYYRLSSPEVKEANNTLRVTNLLVMVSSLQVMIKVDNQNALAWVVGIESNKPLEKAPVQFVSGAGAVLGNCTTDNSGLCKTSLAKHGASDHIYAIVGKAGDKVFGMAASHWNQGVAGWNFNLPTGSDTDEVKVYLYTDRPIYRPGDTIQFKGIARKEVNGRFLSAGLSQVKARLSSSVNEANLVMEIGSQSYPLSAYGTFSGSFVLPNTAIPGSYRLWIEESRYSDLYIKVAEYRKPEIEVKVEFSTKEQKAGDLMAKITGLYYFGAPAAGVKVNWTLTGITSNFYLPENHRAGKLPDFWRSGVIFDPYMSNYLADGTGITGADGVLTVKIPASQISNRIDLESKLELTLEATLEDESGFPISARNSIIMHPAEYYAGVRAENWIGQAGKEFGFTVLTGDWNKKPVGDKSLTARFSQVTWVEEIASGPYEPPRLIPEYKQIASTNFRTDGNGRARLVFTPPDPGNYQVDIIGEGVITQSLVWVGGSGAAPWPKLPNQQIFLQANQESFKPGETAFLFIPNPFAGETPALVSVERGQILRTSVVTINGSSLELPVSLGDVDAPNVFVSVTLLGKRADGKPDFRQGYIRLNVEPSAQILKVEAKASPERLQPGGELKVNLRVTDRQGKGIKGEFSVAVIDKAVLALADSEAKEIVEYFYEPRPLGVLNGLSLVVYAGRIVPAPLGRGGGGGGGPATDAGIRSDFRDTAFWNASVVTSDDGTAFIAFNAPDNLTTWVIDVRGLTADTKVGQATAEVVTTKDLLVRPVTPRFMIAGDRVEMAALVHNNTQASLSVDVSLQTVGALLEDAGKMVQKVEIPAGDRRRISWWVKAGNEKEADLVFSAKAGNLQDATRPAQGKIPIRHFSSPQTFATGGVLTEGGERLEVVSLPRSYTPTGGELRVEMAPSLVAMILPGLKALESYPVDLTEPVMSRLLPNVMTYQLIKANKLDSPDLRSSLEAAIKDGVNRLVNTQNSDGGWGWAPRQPSDLYITSYVVFGLWHASQAGISLDNRVFPKAAQYLQTKTVAITSRSQPFEYDRAVFRWYVLTLIGSNKTAPNDLLTAQDRLSPWGKALLALTLQKIKPGDANARNLITSLQSTAIRSATGASWSSAAHYQNFASGAANTAAVVYALNEFEPASPLWMDAVRYLVMNRKAGGGWASSFDTAWVLLALADMVQRSGDLKANFDYAALVNNSQIASGKGGTSVSALNPVTAVLPISALNAAAPNALQFIRSAGEGRLYYRSYLIANRPVESARSIQKGMMISRAYYPADQDCRKNPCKPLSEFQLNSSARQILARVTLTIPNDMYHVVVEDYIPAGTEILNLSLKTSQRVQPGKEESPVPAAPWRNLHGEGYGWWYFGSSRIYDDRIQWVASYLPAGTYDLTYRLTPNMAGEYRVLPARAWQYYFPEVEAAGAGSVFKIR